MAGAEEAHTEVTKATKVFKDFRKEVELKIGDKSGRRFLVHLGGRPIH
jgi:hypothetical protein